MGLKYKEGPPLRVLLISNNTLQIMLPAMLAAFTANENQKELGGWKSPGAGLLLHHAIINSTQGDCKQIKQNLPGVELLLEAGADPRLQSLFCK